MSSAEPSTENGSPHDATPLTQCSGLDCYNDVKSLKCPTCKKLGNTSYFCSQDCFKNSWPTHQALHVRPNYLLSIALDPEKIYHPPIRRTISCPANATFQSLHRALQIAFGWSNKHTYDFVVKDPTYNKESDPLYMDLAAYMKNRMVQDQEQFGGPPADPGLRKFLLRVVEPAMPSGMGMFGAVDRMHEKGRKHPRTPEKQSNSTRLHMVFDARDYKDRGFQYRHGFGDAWDHEIKIVGRPESTDRFICTNREGHSCAEDVGSDPGWEKLKEAYRAERPTKEQREKMEWFENDCSNCDSAGLKMSKVKRWPKTSVNASLADLIVSSGRRFDWWRE